MHSLSDDVPKALHNVVLISLWCLFSDAIKHFSNAKEPLFCILFGKLLIWLFLKESDAL